MDDKYLKVFAGAVVLYMLTFVSFPFNETVNNIVFIGVCSTVVFLEVISSEREHWTFTGVFSAIGLTEIAYIFAGFIGLEGFQPILRDLALIIVVGFVVYYFVSTRFRVGSSTP